MSPVLHERAARAHGRPLYDRQVRRFFALFLLCACAGCSHSRAPAPCVDSDGDGYGSGCALGPDCDDGDPSRHDDCGDSGAAVDCDLHPLAQGCPCLRGDRQECYEGADSTRDVAGCHSGHTSCIDDVWSSCDGQQLPAAYETCNGIDDDCDGYVDEGVQSPCGGCNDQCVGGVWGPPSSPFQPSDQLDVDGAGELTLKLVQRSALFVWVPNTDEGTLSKLDASSAREVARYRTRGQRPIRVAVDHRGDVWVLDDPQDGPAYLSKVAGLPERCVDRNGDGVRTSQRGDDVLPLGQDECVLLELPLGAAGDAAQALAVDGAPAPDAAPAGNVWVGFANAQRLVELDAVSGKQLGELALPGFAPYAGAFDLAGRLWLIDRGGALARVDPSATPWAAMTIDVPFACYTLEALSIDAQGDLLMSGFGCESVLDYDPLRAAWHMAEVPDLLSPRGVVALSRASWVAYESGQIGSVQRAPLTAGTAYSLASAGLTPYETIALSADSLGSVWAVSTQGGPEARGLATRFDVDAGQVSAQVPVGVGPRGSGDLSGFALAGDYVPEGEASHVFAGCAQPGHVTDAAVADIATHWQTLHVAASLGAYASVEVALRQAADASELANQPFQVLGQLPAAGPDFPLSLADGGAIEVRLVLRSPAAIGAPRIARVGLEWSCPGPE